MAQAPAQAGCVRARMARSVRISDAAFTMFFRDAATCNVCARMLLRCHPTQNSTRYARCFPAGARPRSPIDSKQKQPLTLDRRYSIPWPPQPFY